MKSIRPVYVFVLGVVAGIVLVLAGEFALLTGLALYTKKTPEEIAGRLKPPPVPASMEADFTIGLKSLDGASFRFDELRGKTIFLTFWNPDCDSCEAQLPLIEQLYERLAATDIAFVMAASPGSGEVAREQVKKYGVTFPAYVLDNARAGIYYTPTTPATFIIDPAGKIAYRHDGPARWNDERVVDYLLRLAPEVTALPQ